MSHYPFYSWKTLIKGVSTTFMCIVLPVLTRAQHQFHRISMEAAALKLPNGFRSAVFADKSNVRPQPSNKGNVLDNLSIGTPVEVLYADSSLTTIDGRMGYWHKIEWHNEEGHQKKGWIWGPLLAMGYGKDGDTQFMLGISACKEERDEKTGAQVKRYDYEIRAIQPGKITVAYNISSLTAPESGQQCFALFDNRGIDEIQNVIHFQWYGACCACGSWDYYIFWDSQKFQALPVLEQQGEQYGYTQERYIFPDEPEGKKSAGLLYCLERSSTLSEDIGDVERDLRIYIRKMQYDGERWLKPEIKVKE